jgi:hypothetical protein
VCVLCCWHSNWTWLAVFFLSFKTRFIMLFYCFVITFVSWLCIWPKLVLYEFLSYPTVALWIKRGCLETLQRCYYVGEWLVSKKNMRIKRVNGCS